MPVDDLQSPQASHTREHKRNAQNIRHRSRLTLFSKSISSFSFPMRSSFVLRTSSSLMFSWCSLASSWKHTRFSHTSQEWDIFSPDYTRFYEKWYKKVLPNWEQFNYTDSFCTRLLWRKLLIYYSTLSRGRELWAAFDRVRSQITAFVFVAEVSFSWQAENWAVPEVNWRPHLKTAERPSPLWAASANQFLTGILTDFEGNKNNWKKKSSSSNKVKDCCFSSFKLWLCPLLLDLSL